MTKKLISSILIGLTIMSVCPTGAYAEWKNNSSGWWYDDGDSYYTGWNKVDGKWYHFRNDGYMDKGWIKDGAWWYYLKNNGVMATGELNIGDNLYEFDNSGKWINNDLPHGFSISENNANYNEDSNTGLKPSKEKLGEVNDFSWFNEKGNTYFKVTNTIFAYGGWNIDGNVYIFDKNGILQKGEYTVEDGSKYLLGDDGKFVKGITNEKDELWVQGILTTKSNTSNYDVELDDKNMMDLSYVYSGDTTKNGVLVNDKGDDTKATVKGKTLYCKTNQSIYLGTIKVKSADSDSKTFPNLLAVSDSTDETIVYPGIDISLEDGFYKDIHPKINTHKPGKATVTINVNGTKTSFDVVVTE